MSDRSSAPGKIMLAGEYAVLDGGLSVLMAVNRRAVATLTSQPPAPTPFIQAIIDELLRRGLDVTRARGLAVDSDALRDPGGTKLGLGSSAAVTVAATALALGSAYERDLAHDIAHRAHQNAQALRGDPGSGADIAASIHGGVIAAWRADDPREPMSVEPLRLPAGLHLVPVWTGVAADTATLVAAVRAAADDNPGDHRRALTAIADAAEALARALRDDDAGAAVAAIENGGVAVAGLGRLSGVVLSARTHQRLAAMAASHGGAAKPTGAGAGDIALAAFTDADSAASFRKQAVSEGMTCPALDVDPSGVDFL
jgi:phosphomevalonate kinase